MNSLGLVNSRHSRVFNTTVWSWYEI